MDRMDTEEAGRRKVDPVSQRELDQFKASMQQSRMQHHRMQPGYEPISQPPSQRASRVRIESTVSAILFVMLTSS